MFDRLRFRLSAGGVPMAEAALHELVPGALPPFQLGGGPGALQPGVPKSLVLSPGKIVGLEGPVGWGLTRLGLSLLAAPSQVGTVVVIDVRGWLSPMAAWEEGVIANRLVVVRCAERRVWTQVTAALLEGVAAVYAEVPSGIGESELRRLAALTRARKAGLALRPLRGQLPAGITHLRVRGTGVVWEGPDQGHGRLGSRRLSIELAGKSIPHQALELDNSVKPQGSAGSWRMTPGSK